MSRTSTEPQTKETRQARETRYRGRPHRRLDPDLAAAITEAKERSGMTWRQIGAATGVAHGHLVMISRGYRVPSRVVAVLLASVLVLDDETLRRLFEVAVDDAGRSRRLQQSR